MNNIFQNTTLHYFMHLQFKFEIFRKNQRNKLIQEIYIKKRNLCQFLKLCLKQCIIAPQKDLTQKSKKKIFCRGLSMALGKEICKKKYKNPLPRA